tara:strand:- start:1575 stop:2480 length:906 start_codon:yes stop_codon:yes gene_type:complete
MEIAAHIHYLLYRHDCVSLPGFGAFLVGHKEAYFDAEQQLYHPPSKVLSFNEQLQYNDGILASHMATVQQCSYERSVLDIHHHIISWKERVQKGRLHIASLGVFETNAEGKLVFSADHGLNFLAASYALPQLDVQPISRSTAQAVTAPVFTLAPQQSSTFVRKAMLAASFLVLLALGVNHVQDQQTDAIWQQEQALRENARAHATAAIYDLGELPTLSVIAPHPATIGYHVIAGSFRSQNNADRLVTSLRRKGYYQAARLPKTTNGFHQVSFAAYASQREAYNAKAGILEDNYPDAWVLKK